MVGKDLIMATLFGGGSSSSGSGEGGIPQEDIDAAFAALAEKGVTVPDGATSADLDDLIASIVTGGSGSGYVTGTFTLAENTANYKMATYDAIPDFLLIYRIDETTPGDYVFAVIAAARVGDEMYQAAYRNTSTPAAFKSVSTYAPNGMNRYSGVVQFRKDSMYLYLDGYTMVAGTYGYIFGMY